MNVSRRWFIGGMAATMGTARVLRAAPGLLSGGTPNLVLGIVTDIHLSIARSNGAFVFGGEATFRSTLEWFRDRGVDGVVICGDMADNGLVEELQAVARVWYEVFPNDLAPDGRRVERLFVYGNHDYDGYTYGTARNLFGDGAYDHSINKDLAAAWQSCFNEAYAPVWRKEVKGYSFVGAHWIADRCRGWNEVGVPQMPDWFAANGATLDPSKPFFYIQHPPPKDTCHCDWVWGHDNGASTAALSPYPNAVALSGHSHASLNDERAIWQGAFTSIGAASLKYIGLEYGDVTPFGRENDLPISSQRGEDPYKVMQKMPGGDRDGHQGLLARVFDDRIAFERVDCADFTSLGDDWVVPMPLADPPPFAYAARAAASLVPEFPDGAALQVRLTTGTNRGGGSVQAVEQSVLEVTIPAALRAGCGRALDYALKITDGSGIRDDRYVFAEKFFRSTTSGAANVPTVCKLPVSRLGASGPIHIEVTPRNSFGRAGAPISTDFELPAVPFRYVEYVESTGTQYVNTGIRGRCNTSADMRIKCLSTNDVSFLSSRTDSNNTRFLLCSTLPQYYMGHRSYTASRDKSNLSCLAGTEPDHVVSSITHDGTNVSYSMSVNGTTIIDQTRAEEALDTGLNMYLFAQNKGGSATLNSKVRCYGVKIWQDGALVRDFRPCVRGGKAGLFDEVSRSFFFAYGGDLLPPVETPDAFVQYVESNGTQYVDTGIKGRCNTKADMTLRLMKVADTTFLGARNDNGNTRFLLCHGNSQGLVCTGHVSFDWGDKHLSTSHPDRLVGSIMHDGTQATILATLNGQTSVSTSREQAALDTGLNMYMFAANMSGTATYRASIRCYATRIWQDGVLVRDFWPCVKGGIAGLYDKVSGRIFQPGSGALAAGPVTARKAEIAKFVPYVESTGAQFVDTGVMGRAGTRCEATFNMTEVAGNGNYGILSMRHNTNYQYGDTYRWFDLLSVYNGKLDCQYGTWHDNSALVLPAGRVVTAASKLWAGSQEFAVDGERIRSSSNAHAYDMGFSLYAFGRNRDYSATDVNFSRLRLYSMKIWQGEADGSNEALVRDFRPCVTVDGEAGLYDEVSGMVFVSASGSKLHPPNGLTFRIR